MCMPSMEIPSPAASPRPPVALAPTQLAIRESFSTETKLLQRKQPQRLTLGVPNEQANWPVGHPAVKPKLLMFRNPPTIILRPQIYICTCHRSQRPRTINTWGGGGVKVSNKESRINPQKPLYFITSEKEKIMHS